MHQHKHLTLADVANLIADRTDLTATRRRDIASALKATTKVLQKELAHTPANIRALRSALKKVHPAQQGYSKKRWQNIRSDLLFAVRLILDSDKAFIRKTILSADWQAIMDQLPTKRYKNGLSAFIRFCSRQNIAPTQVNDNTADHFIHYLEEHTLKDDPRGTHRKACRIWNEVNTLLELQTPIISVPNYRKPKYTLPWDQFSPDFITDVEKYFIWLSGANLLADHQPPRYCKPSTIALRKKHIQIIASSATLHGVDLSSLTSLKDLVLQSTARAAIEYQLAQNNNKPTRYIRDLVMTLTSIAKYWVQASDVELTWYRDLLKRLTIDAPGLTAKNRDHLRQFDSTDNIKRLLNLPQQLIKQLEKSPLPPNRQALQYQTALAIEILLMAPMRIGNLSSLRLDKNIRRINSHTVHLIVSEDMVKNAVPLEFPLPERTRKMLDGYINKYRHHLTNCIDNQYLFPGKNGHKIPPFLGSQIKNVIKRKTGIVTTAHQFRHLAAKLYLDAHPGGYELVRQVLGHKSMSTTIQFYSGMETHAAVRHFDKTILGLIDSDGGK